MICADTCLSRFMTTKDKSCINSCLSQKKKKVIWITSMSSVCLFVWFNLPVSSHLFVLYVGGIDHVHACVCYEPRFHSSPALRSHIKWGGKNVCLVLIDDDKWFIIILINNLTQASMLIFCATSAARPCWGQEGNALETYQSASKWSP